jgi:hypothetical protein
VVRGKLATAADALDTSIAVAAAKLKAAQPTEKERRSPYERRTGHDEARAAVAQQLSQAGKTREFALKHATQHKVDASAMLQAFDDQVKRRFHLSDAAAMTGYDWDALAPHWHLFEERGFADAFAGDLARSPTTLSTRSRGRSAASKQPLPSYPARCREPSRRSPNGCSLTPPRNTSCRFGEPSRTIFAVWRCGFCDRRH